MGGRLPTAVDLKGALRRLWRAVTTWQFVVGVGSLVGVLAAGRQVLRGNGSDEVWFSPWVVLGVLVAWLALRRAARLVDELSFAYVCAFAVQGVLFDWEPFWLSLGTILIVSLAASALYRVWSPTPTRSCPI